MQHCIFSVLLGISKLSVLRHANAKFWPVDAMSVMELVRVDGRVGLHVVPRVQECDKRVGIYLKTINTAGQHNNGRM